jgi:hypothetical protein
MRFFSSTLLAGLLLAHFLNHRLLVRNYFQPSYYVRIKTTVVCDLLLIDRYE